MKLSFGSECSQGEITFWVVRHLSNPELLSSQVGDLHLMWEGIYFLQFSPPSYHWEYPSYGHAPRELKRADFFCFPDLYPLAVLRQTNGIDRGNYQLGTSNRLWRPKREIFFTQPAPGWSEAINSWSMRRKGRKGRQSGLLRFQAVENFVCFIGNSLEAGHQHIAFSVCWKVFSGELWQPCIGTEVEIIILML